VATVQVQNTDICLSNFEKVKSKYMAEDESASRRLKIVQGHLRRASANHATTFQYTLDNDILSFAERQFYEENGYLVVRGLVKENELKKYSQRFEEICKGTISVPFLTVMKDVTFAKNREEQEERTVNKIQDFHLDPVLSEYIKTVDILKYVECFTGPDIMAVHTMLINKPPDPGTKTSRHPLHQDLHYFPFRPADRIVCAWTALEKVYQSNGCLVVLPGTHKTVLMEHEYPNWQTGVNKFYHGIKDFDPTLPRLHLEMDAGDTVFFHPILIHGSGINKTKRFRKAISTHYASSHCHYINVNGTSQEKLAEELRELARRRYGNDFNISFEEIWKFKSLLVKGIEDSL